MQPKDELETAFTSGELTEMIADSRREGLLDDEESSRIARTLSSAEATVADVVVATDEIVTLPARPTVDQLTAAVAATGFSRFPVRGPEGRLTGYLHVKDVLDIADGAGIVIPPQRIRSLPEVSATDRLDEAMSALRNAARAPGPRRRPRRAHHRAGHDGGPHRGLRRHRARRDARRGDAVTVALTVAALPEAVWRRRAAAHRERIATWTGPHRERRRRGEPHPVRDFLFTYYSHRPAKLEQWDPGPRVRLVGDAREFLDRPGYRRDGDGAAAGVVFDPADAPDRLRTTAGFLHGLLAATAARAPRLGCFGLHEWAMVYRTDAPRHGVVPLRLGADGTDAVVEELDVHCTHYDAYRFFTEAARPHNALEPTREQQAELEQPGCLHATMDLYKWAYKLAPACPSELMGDCFALAPGRARAGHAGEPVRPVRPRVLPRADRDPGRARRVRARPGRVRRAGRAAAGAADRACASSWRPESQAVTSSSSTPLRAAATRSASWSVLIAIRCPKSSVITMRLSGAACSSTNSSGQPQLQLPQNVAMWRTVRAPPGR